jgi:Na+-translocating ferredoxin:NAD+ oxidoreductase subunit B
MNDPGRVDNGKVDKGRRELLRTFGRCIALGGLACVGLAAARRDGTEPGAGKMIWQVDPYKCVACGNCSTYCVRGVSAVKCVHTFAMCGYCDLCTGFFDPDPRALDTGAENQLCPTGAIIRTFVGDPYYEYRIDARLCVGCGKCVKGCKAFGNGSLYLQVRHDLCRNCNECSIAVACPSEAFRRVPAREPYLLKGTSPKGTNKSG